MVKINKHPLLDALAKYAEHVYFMHYFDYCDPEFEAEFSVGYSQSGGPYILKCGLPYCGPSKKQKEKSLIYNGI